MKYSILIAVVAFLALTYSQTIGPGEPDSRCPPNAPVNPPFHISHPTNCSLFMTCIGGNAFPQACPSGQHWASSLNRCDWPDVAQCEEGVGNDCPPGSPNPPVFLPHPTDCSRFFQCANGRPVEISCPPGQEWSQENGWCDWPDRANCRAGNGTTTAPGNSTSRPSSSESREAW